MNQNHILGLALVVGELRLQVADLSTELQIARAQVEAAEKRVAELEAAAADAMPPESPGR